MSAPFESVRVDPGLSDSNWQLLSIYRRLPNVSIFGDRLDSIKKRERWITKMARITSGPWITDRRQTFWRKKIKTIASYTQWAHVYNYCALKIVNEAIMYEIYTTGGTLERFEYRVEWCQFLHGSIIIITLLISRVKTKYYTLRTVLWVAQPNFWEMILLKCCHDRNTRKEKEKKEKALSNILWRKRFQSQLTVWFTIYYYIFLFSLLISFGRNFSLKI
jgi:hypothetical protein